MLIASGLHKFAPGSMHDVNKILKSQLFLSLTWAVLGFAILVQQVKAAPIRESSIETSTSETSTSDDNDKDQNVELASYNQATLNSIVGFHLTQELHQIMEIKFESKNDPEPTAEVALLEAGHFRELFRMVISPNAP